MAKAPRKKQDKLDLLAAGPLDRVVQLMLWKGRHRDPTMSLLIREEDIVGFDECMAYQELKPALMVYRPEGRPAQAAVPAVGKRRAIPAVPAEPPRPFVIVSVVQEGTKHAIKPIENNERDYGAGDLARRQAAARGRAPELAAAIRRSASTGDFTSGTLEAAAEVLDTLSKVLP